MELRNGIAAFDPVTLRIAAEQLLTVQLPEALRRRPARPPGRPVRGRSRPFAVIARIDTGQLTWDRDASREVFTTYRGTEASGVRLSGAKVAQLDDVPVARVSVRLNGDKLRAWFAELPAETPLDSLEITERVRTWMRDFSRHDKRVDTLTVPQQNVNYEALRQRPRPLRPPEDHRRHRRTRRPRHRRDRHPHEPALLRRPTRRQAGGRRAGPVLVQRGQREQGTAVRDRVHAGGGVGRRRGIGFVPAPGDQVTFSEALCDCGPQQSRHPDDRDISCGLKQRKETHHGSDFRAEE
ncbi:hypothetical protein QP028_14130 [Corynebacterium suedekumii]|nr:hypothetical protein QP028_14130 [Corynebacterium suedekumii]